MPEAIPAAALDSHVAIIGKTGSGKTYAAKGAVESLLTAGRRVVILDPTGAWWGLRSRADGKAAGFPIVILGGRHGHMKLAEGTREADAGAAIGRVLAARNTSAVLDLSDFSVAGMHRFATAFAESIYQHTRAALHLIIDEADEFAPQRPRPESTLMLNRFDRIVRRGRSRGFRVMMVTQRPAVLNKDLLSQAACLVAMQLLLPGDRRVVEEWVKGQADPTEGAGMLADLPRLPRGTGYVWWPDGGVLARRQFPPIATFDSSAAPTGDGPQVDIDTTPAQGLEDLRAALAAIATPPAKGKAAAAATAPDPLALAQARLAGYGDGYKSGQAATAEEVQRMRSALRTAAADLLLLAGDDGEPGVPPQPVPGKPKTTPPRSPAAAPRAASTDTTLGPERRILNVLGARHPARFTMPQWATLAGMKRTGGTWQTYVSRLRSAGLIEAVGGLYGLTDAGLAAADTTPPSGNPLDQWKAALGTGPARMLDYLARWGAVGCTRAELATAVDMAASGGTFQTYLSRIRSNGLIEVGADNVIRLANVLREAA